MLKSLEFENFKSWGGRHRLDFGRITGLFGANSSGKSSIIHLLLLLKQTAESSSSARIVNFGGKESDYVDLGSFVDIASDHDPENTVSYSLKWSPAFIPDNYSDFIVDNIEVLGRIKTVSWLKGEAVYVDRLEYRVGHSYDPSYLPDSLGHFEGELSVSASGITSDSYSIELSLEGKPPDGRGILDRHELNDGRDPKTLFEFHPSDIDTISRDVNLYLAGDEPTPYLTTDRRFIEPEYISYHEEYYDLCEKSGIYDGTINISYDIKHVINKVQNQTDELLEGIVYLGPLRDRPRRTYNWTGVSPGTVGSRGELAIDILLAEKHVRVEAVSKWLRKIGIAESLELRPMGRGARTWEAVIEKADGETTVNLADVGFGVSQVLPVIVCLLSAPAGSLVILEHPDIHLHPRAQGELADLLIDVSRASDIQVLVESHSEHLLARIQRRIAESARGDGSLGPEDVRLYFCKQEEGRSELEPLKMQPSGVITNWPRDFFGDMLAERMALSGFYPKSDGLPADD